MSGVGEEVIMEDKEKKGRIKDLMQLSICCALLGRTRGVTRRLLVLQRAHRFITTGLRGASTLSTSNGSAIDREWFHGALIGSAFGGG
jgi:hypothetical protein